MSKRLLALLLALSFVLGGCNYRGGGEESSYASVYRMRTDSGSGGALLVREGVPYSTEEDPVDAMLAALNSKPGTAGLGRVFPEGVRAHSCLIENGVATIRMSEGFTKLDEMSRLLCGSALALTFCTLDAVCSINVECDGKVYIAGLRPEDIQQADAIFEDHERTAKLFLPANGAKGLMPRSHTLKMDGGESMETLMARAVLDALPVYTESTAVLSAETADGICVLELSEAFYGNEPADQTAGMLIIYSLVNSLCRLNNVDGVTITVEGQPVVSYGGFRASWPLSAREDLVIY